MMDNDGIGRINPIIALLLIILVMIVCVGAYFVWVSGQTISDKQIVEPLYEIKTIELFDRTDGFFLGTYDIDSIDMVSNTEYLYCIDGYEPLYIDSDTLLRGENLFAMKRSNMWKFYYRVVNPFEKFHPRFTYLGNNECYDGCLNIVIKPCFHLNYMGYEYTLVHTYSNGSILIKLPK